MIFEINFSCSQLDSFESCQILSLQQVVIIAESYFLISFLDWIHHSWQFRLEHVLIGFIAKGHDKYKIASTAKLWPAYYIAIIHFWNHLRYIKTKSYSLWIDLFPRLKKSKQFEEFRLILFTNSNTRIFYLYLKKFLIAIFLQSFYERIILDR